MSISTKLQDKARDDASVRMVRKRMADIQKLVAFPLDKAPTAEQVKELNVITAEALKEISKKQK